MPVLGALEPRTFIQRYWQKEPLLVRGALDPVSGVVNGDALAGLACDELVESRLVIADAAKQDWSCEHGPFEESRFSGLPATGWTLLVQAVDQWIPEVTALLAHFDFLPRWRMDDVMVSFATDGGGVGPHFDHYDVFLLQVEGARCWKVGQRCDTNSPLRDHPDLKLLEAFDTREEWRLDAGDMLYLPPGVAHWGTAAGGNCITCSIGFRAPSRAEIIQGAIDHVLPRFTDDERFADAPASVDGDPYCINEAALESVIALWPDDDTLGLAEALATAFGRLVTEPRNPTLIAPEMIVDPHSATASSDEGRSVALHHHPASRFAYRLTGNSAVLFVDGEAHPAKPAVAKGICHGELPAGAMRDGGTRELLARLIESGSLRLPS